MHLFRRLMTAALTALTVLVLAAPTARAATAEPAGVDLARSVGDYVAPFRAGASYQRPGPADRDAIATGVAELAAGRTEAGRCSLARASWTTTELLDRATGRIMIEAADGSSAREARRGWGRVYVDATEPQGAHRYSVEVPHPVADANSEQVATAIFREAPGGVLIVAGAHREVVDPAHDATTVFAAVADRLRLPAVQVHGFAATALPGFDAIPSPGAGQVTPEVRATADRLAAAGFQVCRVWQRPCGDLGGTTNVEGGYAAAHAVPFLHLELAPPLRSDPGLVARVAAAVAGGLPW